MKRAKIRVLELTTRVVTIIFTLYNLELGGVHPLYTAAPEMDYINVSCHMRP